MGNKTGERLCIIKESLNTNISTNMSHSSAPFFTTFFWKIFVSPNPRQPSSSPPIFTKFSTCITNFVMIYGTRETFFYAWFSLFKFFYGTFLHYFDAIKTCVRNSYKWSWRFVVLNFSYGVLFSLITRKISSV